MSDTDPPKIKFPCENYPIKTVGDAGQSFYDFVIAVIEKHAPAFDRSRITVKDSRNARFQSVTVFITATGEPQLQAIFDELKANPVVKMVL